MAPISSVVGLQILNAVIMLSHLLCIQFFEGELKGFTKHVVYEISSLGRLWEHPRVVPHLFNLYIVCTKLPAFSDEIVHMEGVYVGIKFKC